MTDKSAADALRALKMHASEPLTDSANDYRAGWNAALDEAASRLTAEEPAEGPCCTDTLGMPVPCQHRPTPAREGLDVVHCDGCEDQLCPGVEGLATLDRDEERT